MNAPLLAMERIRKVYPNGVIANDDVCFAVDAGEIHGLVGENGAGKSTLMGILFGLESPDRGRILLEGQPLSIYNPQVAIAHGIGMVHQHFMLVPSLTVAENIVLGVEPRRGITIDLSEALRITEALSARYELDIDPTATVRDLPVGTKQKLEILKALHRGARILILDEPTAVLTPQETDQLFAQLRLLREEGSTIIFISHKLGEIQALCDRVTVMRLGRSRGVFDLRAVTEREISRLMVGRDVVLRVEKGTPSPVDTVLDVKGLTVMNLFGKSAVRNVSFSVRRGEIVGIAGVEGNGQRELVEAVTGLGTCSEGSISIQGNGIQGLDVRGIRALGLSHIPEDRMSCGCAASLSVELNLSAGVYDRDEYAPKGILDQKALRRNSTARIDEYRIRCASPDQNLAELSGGNIQKVVVAREFSPCPALVVADQPTRGIDVGATEFIWRRLVELRDRGSAVLLVSADLNEILELSDSLIVMYGGAIAAYIEETSGVSEEELGLYMLGLKMQKAELIAGARHE